MPSPDAATIQVLRRDLALQIARYVARRGTTQVAAARLLGIPQPTLSKIANAQVADISLELLIRIAVRAQLPVVLQTGKDPSEAGVFVSAPAAQTRVHRSPLNERARLELEENVQSLTPEQRLDAQLTHSRLLTQLRQGVKGTRGRMATPRRQRDP